jgi:hypothetical protein
LRSGATACAIPFATIEPSLTYARQVGTFIFLFYLLSTVCTLSLIFYVHQHSVSFRVFYDSIFI